MKTLRLAVFVVCLLPAVAVLAQAPGRSAPPTAALPEVAFLAGHWAEVSEKVVSEEIWTASSGDSMTGSWRYVADGKLQSLALLSIREEGGTPVLRIRHFDADLVPREEKALVLKLVDKGNRYARFEGSAAGSSGPVTLVYKRDGDALSGTLTRDGKSEEFRFRLRRWGGASSSDRFRHRRPNEGPRS
jgi:hypothetical protein